MSATNAAFVSCSSQTIAGRWRAIVARMPSIACSSAPSVSIFSDVRRRDRRRRATRLVDRDDRDVDLVAHVGVAAGRREVRPARLADDEQARRGRSAAPTAASRISRVLEAVELDVAARPRARTHGTGSNATTRPCGADEARAEEREEADVRADVVEDVARREQPPQRLLHRRLERAAHDQPGVGVVERQVGGRDVQQVRRGRRRSAPARGRTSSTRAAAARATRGPPRTRRGQLGAAVLRQPGDDVRRAVAQPPGQLLAQLAKGGPGIGRMIAARRRPPDVRPGRAAPRLSVVRYGST